MSRASLTEANAITDKPLDFFRDDYFVPLKPYVSEREKGVCYIAFEHRWARFVHHYRDQLEAFAKRYLLSSSIPFGPRRTASSTTTSPAFGPARIPSSPASATLTISIRSRASRRATSSSRATARTG